MPYRAGYTPEQRREIEARLSAGELRAVVTTDALELGIDVGTLDAAVVVAFPGTIASLRQMWGRAGRRRRGLAVYVAGADALDQFFARHTDDFLERPVESAILDHESEEIHLAHLLCAAHEGPLSQRDEEFFGPRTLAYLERLEGLGELRERAGQFVLRARERYPAGEVSLRSASPDSFAIIEVASGEVVGGTEAARAFSTLHPGAIYLHMGRSFHVRELDLDTRRALVEPFDGDWYTQPKRETDTLIERLLDRRDALGLSLSFGRVLVTETVLAYQRRRLSDHREIDLTALELPSTRFATQAMWFELDADGSRRLPARAPARLAARRRARPDRGAAAARDVRPLGHRRALHQRAPPDRRADDLHPRRASRRRRHHPHRLRPLRGARRRRAPADQRVPLPRGLPVVCAVAEVRQPQRAALEGRCMRVARTDAGARRLSGGIAQA